MKNQSRKTFKLYIIILITILLTSVYNIETNIKPTLISICEVRAKVIATQIINDTVRDELEKEDLKEQILIPSYDNEGKVNMIITDAHAMNTISSNIAKSVQEKIEGLQNQSFTIPLGSAINSQILADKGPNLKYNIMHEGSVLVDFITEFAESGINQTRYKIYITVAVDMRIISPVTTTSITVNNNVLIAEVVIVGDVPDSYMKVPLKDSLWIDE